MIQKFRQLKQRLSKMNKSLLAFLIASSLLYLIATVVARSSGIKERIHSLSNDQTKDVKLVVVVTRHGDRTPIFNFKPENLESDTWGCDLPATIEAVPFQIFDEKATQPRLYRKIYKKDIESFKGNCASGQLTIQGMRQHFALGEKLRNKYKSLLEQVELKYGSKQVYVESSDIPRTFLSAQSQLLSLFPPKPSTSLLTDEIIPILTTELTVTDFFPNRNKCPKVGLIETEVQKSKPYQDFEKSVSAFKSDLSRRLKYTNATISSFPKWSQIYDNFYCRRAHKYPLPEGFSEEYVDQIIQVAEKEYTFVLQDREYVELGMGPLFTRIKTLLTNRVTEVDLDLKYALFSGHDTTIAPLLALFGLYDGHWPPYASNLVFELSQSYETLEYSLKLIYNDKELTIPGCSQDNRCPWKIFDQITKRFEIKDQDELVKRCKL
ncbi:cf60 [Acrasis kona]|uniref:Cf60 n=1 Tax=Acrasis kona TaxID=1008807 RepID=A0AAW2YJT5_9EUKA